MLASAPMTFTPNSTYSQERACKCTFDFHSQVNFTSQERDCQCTFDFHSQVNSLLSSSHSGLLATVARTSFVVQSSSSCELETATRCHTSCCAGRLLWAGFCSLRGAVAAQLLPIGATRLVGEDTLKGLGSTLSYPFCGASSLLN